ncbi:MAG TPA: NAD(P)H-dependent oxidoreductase subunit E [Mariprofundaceae bacterium]|nr:NAD(P)H-dependent oxidoreductase subunit E [Mariprofundaceae bacterium]
MQTPESSLIDAFVHQLPYPRSGLYLVACLQDAQARFGWISQEAMVAIALYLGVERATVAGVADACPDAFLTSRPEHAALLVCNGPVCSMHGSDDLCRKLRLQGLHPVAHECLAACDRAPAARCGSILLAPATVQDIGQNL